MPDSTAVRQGESPLPFDPLGFRAGVGAAEPATAPETESPIAAMAARGVIGGRRGWRRPGPCNRTSLSWT